MMTAFEEQDYPNEPKRYVKIYWTQADNDFLKALAVEADMPMGAGLHTLLEMLYLVVGSAKESASVDENTKMPALELFVARIMHLLGLLADDEFDRAVILADVMGGERSDLRMRGLAQMANERLDQLRPIWAAARAEAAQRKTEWQPEEAARRTAKAMLAAEKAHATDSAVEPG